MGARDPEEREVWCKECMARLHYESIYEGPGVTYTDPIRVVPCPTTTECNRLHGGHATTVSRREARELAPIQRKYQ